MAERGGTLRLDRKLEMDCPEAMPLTNLACATKLSIASNLCVSCVLFLLHCEPRWLLSAAAVALAWFDDVKQREIPGHIIGLRGTVQAQHEQHQQHYGIHYCETDGLGGNPCKTVEGTEIKL